MARDIQPKLSRQESFKAGELDPGLHSAFSLDAYGTGLRLCRNWIITRYGTLLNRPGTRLIQQAKSGLKARLIPFNFSDNQAYMLEFTNGYMRAFNPSGSQATVAVGAYTALGASVDYRSADSGASWGTGATVPAGTFYDSAIKADWSLAVAVGASVCATSTDKGLTWTARTIPAGTYRAVCWTGTRWVAVGDAGIFAYSTDGISWSGGTNDAGVSWRGVAANGATVVAVGHATNFSYSSKSTDHGQTWAAKVTIENATGTVISGRITFSVTHFVMSFTERGSKSYFNSVQIYRSSDGVAWVEGPYFNQGVQDRSPVVISEGANVLVLGSVSTSLRSNDSGLTWTSIPTPGFANGAAYGGAGVVVAVGSGWIYLSADYGASWTSVAISGVLHTAITAVEAAWDVASPYLTADLYNIRASQVGDVMTLTCRGHLPRNISRTPNGIGPMFKISNYFSPAPGTLVTGLSLTGGDTTGDADHPLREWAFVVTWEDSAGVESLPSAPLIQTMSRHPDRPASIAFNAVTGAARYHVYVGRNGEYGYIGSTLTTTFNDDGALPLLSYDPPKWQNPFTLENPAVAIWHEDRIAFANTPSDPGKIWWSGSGEYKDFDESTVMKDEDSFYRTLASLRFEEIRAMLVIGELLIFTSEAEWAVGGNGEPVSFRNLSAVPQTYNGSSWVPPITINKEALFVQSNGNEVRNLFRMSDGWESDDLSALVEHLFRDRTVVDWAYAHRPYKMIWAVMSDGDVVSLTYDRKQEVWAWARHDILNANVIGVATVPYFGQDVPWFVVERGGNYYIERLSKRDQTTPGWYCGLDGAIYLVTQTPTAGSLTVTGLGHLGTGTPAYMCADDKVYGPVNVTAGGEATFTGLPASIAVLWVGTQITAQVESLDYGEGRTLEKVVGKIIVETSVEDDPPDSAMGIYAGEDVNHLSRVAFSNVRQGLIEIIPSTQLNPGARCAVQMLDPAPIEIRGITREIVTGF